MAAFDPRRYRETATGREVFADEPDTAAGVEASGEYERLLPEPRFFINKADETAVLADTLDAFSGVSQDDGFRPATTEEAEKARAKIRADERYAIERQGVAFPRTAAFLEGAGSTIPFYPYIQQATGGSSVEQQEQRAEEYPFSRIAGQITGAVGTLGAGPLLKGAAAASKVATGVRGLVAGQALLGDVAASGVAKATQALFPVAAESGLAKTAIGAASGIARTLPFAAATELNESILENRNMSGEAMLWDALMGGGVEALTTGVPLATKTLAKTKWAQEKLGRLATEQAERTLKRMDPSGGELRRATKQIGRERYYNLINQAHERGVFGVGKSSQTVLDRTRAELAKAGDLIGQIADEAAIREPVKSVVNMDRLFEQVSDEVIAPLSRSSSMADQSAARSAREQLELIKSNYPDGMTLRNLSDTRTQISDYIYGITGQNDPLRSSEIDALHDIRHALTRELEKGFERASIPPSLWKAGQQEYELYSRANQLAAKSVLKQGAASSADVGSAVSRAVNVAKHGLKGFVLSAAYDATKAGLSGGYSRMLEAANRAAKAGAAPEIVADLEALAAQQADAARRNATLVLKPADAARAEYLKNLDETVSMFEYMAGNPNEFSPEATKAAEEAYYTLSAAYRKNMSPEDAAKALTQARDRLSQSSRFTTGTDKLKYNASVSPLRAMRDNIEMSLSDASLWGAERAETARAQAARVIGARVDPERVAALQALQDSVNDARRRVSGKTEKLMGAKPGTVVLPKAKTELYDLWESLHSPQSLKLDSAPEPVPDPAAPGAFP